MEKRKVNTRTFSAKLSKEVTSVGGLTMRGAPQSDSLPKSLRRQPWFPKDVDIAAPFLGRIYTLRSIPVMVARGNIDRNRIERCQGLPQELGSIRHDSGMLVEIASAEECIGVDFTRDVHNRKEDFPQRLSPAPRCIS